VTFYPPAIGLIDFEGELLHNERVGEDSYKVSHIGNGRGTPLFLVGGKIYGAQPFLMDHHRMKAADI